jgi:hypothetical protein
MTTRIITAAELSPGIPLTVLEEHKDETHDTVLAAMRPCPWIGAPLKVVSVDLPFALMETHVGQRVTFDTRRYTFMELKPEFWSAAAGDESEAETTPGSAQLLQLIQYHNALVHRVAALEAAPQPTPKNIPVGDALLYIFGGSVFAVLLHFFIQLLK